MSGKKPVLNQLTNQSFPSTYTVTSKNKNVISCISENIVSSLCETSMNPSLNI